MTRLVIDVLEFVADYADELGDQDELLTEFDEDTGLVLFCREFFNQFVAEQFDVQVNVFSSHEAGSVWVKVLPQLGQADGRELIIGAFREFCQDFDTIIGEHYDRGGELTAFQTEFVPDLLESITNWATDMAREDIADAAGAALDTLREALRKAGSSREHTDDHGSRACPGGSGQGGLRLDASRARRLRHVGRPVACRRHRRLGRGIRTSTAVAIRDDRCDRHRLGDRVRVRGWLLLGSVSADAAPCARDRDVARRINNSLGIHASNPRKIARAIAGLEQHRFGVHRQMQPVNKQRGWWLPRPMRVTWIYAVLLIASVGFAVLHI